VTDGKIDIWMKEY